MVCGAIGFNDLTWFGIATLETKYQETLQQHLFLFGDNLVGSEWEKHNTDLRTNAHVCECVWRKVKEATVL